MGKEGPKGKTRDGFKRANMRKAGPNFGKAQKVLKDRLGMVSKRANLGVQRRSQG